SRRRHTRFSRDWSSDVCSSDLESSWADRAVADAPKVAVEMPSSLREALTMMVSAHWSSSMAAAGAEKAKIGRTAALASKIRENRSEERRVGKEGRPAGVEGHEK